MAGSGNCVSFLCPLGAFCDWGYRFISIPVSVSDIFIYPYNTSAIEARLGLSIWLTGGIDLCVSRVPGKLKSDGAINLVKGSIDPSPSGFPSKKK